MSHETSRNRREIHLISDVHNEAQISSTRQRVSAIATGLINAVNVDIQSMNERAQKSIHYPK